MRITTWNCCGGFCSRRVDHCLSLLADLGADLITLQECLQPVDASASVIWRRRPSSKLGVAVVSARESLRLEPIDVPPLRATVVPVVVHAPKSSFVFVGVWTRRPNAEVTYAQVTWEAMSTCGREAKKRNLPMVAAGDFNIWPGLKNGKKGLDALEVLDRMKDELGLVSAYKHFSREEPGAETCMTHYFRFKKHWRVHIDYCFVPEDWLHLLVNVQVAPFEDFKMSDHRPITVELEDSIKSSRHVKSA